MEYVIYKITNIVNGHSYIGQTIDFIDRMKSHYNCGIKQTKSHFKIYKAIKKYGFENFTIKIIDHCWSQKDANKLERYYIKFYNTKKHGYNGTDGGDTWELSSETRKHIAKKQMTAYTEIKKFIEDQNYKLITTEDNYKNVSQIITLQCPNKHKYNVRFYAFKKGNRCNCEFPYKARRPYEFIKETLENKNYKLLTTFDEYYSSKLLKKIKVQCNNNHITELQFENFLKGHRCKKCYLENRSVGKKTQDILKHMNEILKFRKHGYSMRKIIEELKLECSSKLLYLVLRQK